MHSRRHAFTFVELLTSLALLVILMGLMVSLARHVRSASAEDLTHEQLLKLERLMEQYLVRNDGRLPPVNSLINQPHPTEADLSSSALVNNQQFLKVLAPLLERSGETCADYFGTGYDGQILRDAWGSPLVFMPARHSTIGMSPKGWFFFSAGADRRYLTLDDNLYSYEKSALNSRNARNDLPDIPVDPYPQDGGHRE